MATAPTTDDLLVRFPEFEDTDEDLITTVLAEAARCVDDTWIDADFRLGIMLMAAHILSTVDTGAGVGTVSSLSIGPFRETYKAGSASWADGSYYGQRYLQLLRKNQPPILVI